MTDDIEDTRMLYRSLLVGNTPGIVQELRRLESAPCPVARAFMVGYSIGSSVAGDPKLMDTVEDNAREGLKTYAQTGG